MKKIYVIIMMAFFTTQIMAEDLNINGTVMDESGNPVSSQAVYLSSNDSLGFNYSTVVYTNDAGAFSDIVELFEDITQGEIIASTESCNSMITMVEFFNPGNYNLTFNFEICTDTTGGGGGNDTINNGCESSFYYAQNDMEVQFYGEIAQDGDVTFSWNFGDGSTGDGMEVSHSYAQEGSYTVSLETVLNDTCEFSSLQILYVSQDTSGGGNDSTNCQNDFEYTVQDMMVSVNGWGIGNNDVEFYYWSFGDGGNAEGQNTSHEYTSDGDYQITLTTVSYDSCEAITTKTVSIGDSGNQEMLYGTVLVGDASLDVGFASLYSISNDTVGGDDFELVAQTQIDSAGSYFFYNVPQGNYLILSQAGPSSNYFNSTLPTYYGDVIYWVDATIIVLGDPANPYDINLQATSGSNAGEGQISGDIVGEGFKQLLIDENINIFLLDENNTPLEIVYSEIDDSFDFSNIAFGDYVVYAEVIGLPTEAANVSISAENPTTNIEILITPNGVTTGIHDELTIQIKGGIYPNPVVSYAQLELNLTESTNIQMTIINQLGQMIESRSEFMTQGINKLELNTQSYPSGVYFLQIRTASSTVNQKFIKK